MSENIYITTDNRTVVKLISETTTGEIVYSNVYGIKGDRIGAQLFRIPKAEFFQIFKLATGKG